jgi:hypothetical protein
LPRRIPLRAWFDLGAGEAVALARGVTGDWLAA